MSRNNKVMKSSEDERSPRKRGFEQSSYEELIIETMLSDQNEHSFWNLNDGYKTCRGPVVVWMNDVCSYFKLDITTAHAAISYLDRLQPEECVSRHEWQMIAIACILISSKYNETEMEVPQLGILEEIINHNIPNQTMLDYELWVLRRLGWQLTTRTISSFLSSFYSSKRVFMNDKFMEDKLKLGFEDAFVKETLRLSSACLSESTFKCHKTSEVAACILYKLRKHLYMCPVWDENLTLLTGCNPRSSSSDIKAIMQKLQQFEIEMEEDLFLTPPNSQCDSFSSQSFGRTDAESVMETEAELSQLMPGEEQRNNWFVSASSTDVSEMFVNSTSSKSRKSPVSIADVDNF